MDHQAIVDVVLKTAVESLAGEVGSLLGQELSCSDASFRPASKEVFFSETDRDKSTLTHLAVSGDRDGLSYLLVRTSTAIILGGTLIMLPEDSIADQAKAKRLDGEVADAFGEVANILAGVLTQTFLDKYPKNIRFVKTELESLIPGEVDTAAETPFPPGQYYLASCNLSMGGEALGPLEFIFPAQLLDLEFAEAEAAPEPAAATEEALPAATPAAAAAEAAAEPEPAAAPASEAAAAPRPAFADAKAVVDVVLKATVGQVGEEVGALLGQALSCDDLSLELIEKGDYFATRCLEKSVLTRMEVSGDQSGQSYLVNHLSDAIIMGGTLIMLPEEQIDEHVKGGGFDGEVADSFGEVANILAGGLTQVFLDRYPQQLRFVKTEAEIIVPTKITAADEAPFPDGSYYLASTAISLEEKELHRLDLLFPAELLGLDQYEATPAAAGEPPTPTAPAATEAVPATSQQEGVAAAAVQPASAAAAAPPAEPAGPPVVLIVSEQPEDAEAIVNSLSGSSYQCEVIGFQDDIKGVFASHQVLGIFLLMAEVGEKGFAAAIKIQSAARPQPPLIAAGPQWTRSTVLRAVKYGARDILILPASEEEIQEKASQHLLQAS